MKWSMGGIILEIKLAMYQFESKQDTETTQSFEQGKLHIKNCYSISQLKLIKVRVRREL